MTKQKIKKIPKIFRLELQAEFLKDEYLASQCLSIMRDIAHIIDPTKKLSIVTYIKKEK